MTVVTRIHVTGGQGSGKSTLAGRLAAATGLPLHELDRIARVGGGNGPERTPVERAGMVDAIAASDAWITEGVHLDWTGPLLERAEVILWLDQLTPGRASGRILRRFLAGAATEMRTRHGRERFTRVGDYLRHTRDLAGAVRFAHSTNDPDRFANALAPYAVKVVRCRTQGDVETFVAAIEASSADGPTVRPGDLRTTGPAASEPGR